MNKQRKVVITTTYNEMGIIIDTKAEEVAQPYLQPTCNRLATDTISRQAAIDALMEILDRPNHAEFLYTDEICKALSALPPAQQWIPCSETIDIPDHEVLCCDRYGEEMIGWLSYNDDQWLCESDVEMMYDPIAWREKPEPYKEERRIDECTD